MKSYYIFNSSGTQLGKLGTHGCKRKNRNEAFCARLDGKWKMKNGFKQRRFNRFQVEVRVSTIDSLLSIPGRERLRVFYCNFAALLAEKVLQDPSSSLDARLLARPSYSCVGYLPVMNAPRLTAAAPPVVRLEVSTHDP